VRLTPTADEPIQVSWLKRFRRRNMFELIVNSDLAQRHMQKQFGTEPARGRQAAERAERSPRRPAIAARALRVLASACSTAWASFAYRSGRRATELR
jgi:hypothetical protein